MLFELADPGAQLVALAGGLVALDRQLLDLLLPLVDAGLRLLLACLAIGQIRLGLAEPRQQRDTLRLGQVQIALRLFERVRQLADSIDL